MSIQTGIGPWLVPPFVVPVMLGLLVVAAGLIR